MYTVAFLGFSAGFLVNRLAALLRQHGYFLGDAFRIATQIAEGNQVAIPFATLEKADTFAVEARQLGAKLELRLPASTI